jgi:hypothetical protein
VAFGPVAELLVVDDVAAVLQQEAGDGVHDARTFGAVQGQDVLDAAACLPGGAVLSLNSSHGFSTQ